MNVLREKLGNMGSAAVSGLTMVVSVAVLWWGLGVAGWRGGHTTSDGPVWYFDLGTGELFAASAAETPPIPAPSGVQINGVDAGVRAHVFSCGSCSDDRERVVLYLETFHPVIRRLRNGETVSEDEFPSHDPRTAIIKRPGDEGWVLASGREGSRILDELMEWECPDGQRPRYCVP
jgi:hypothetical protein